MTYYAEDKLGKGKGDVISLLPPSSEGPALEEGEVPRSRVPRVSPQQWGSDDDEPPSSPGFKIDEDFPALISKMDLEDGPREASPLSTFRFGRRSSQGVVSEVKVGYQKGGVEPLYTHDDGCLSGAETGGSSGEESEVPRRGGSDGKHDGVSGSDVSDRAVTGVRSSLPSVVPQGGLPSAPGVCATSHHIGYVCRQEQLYQKSTIVESEGRFFRLDLSKANLPPLRAFTPILFSTNLVPGVNFSRTPTFIGHFTRVYIDGQGGSLHPHPVQGSFEDGQPGKLNFLWNPQHVFRNPIRHSVPCSFFPGMVRDVDVSVTFSIRPPRGGAGPAFPFIKAVSLSDSQRGLLDEAVTGFFPPEFLKDLKESPVFEVHIGVGLPENDVFPTVSYSDFNVLSSNRNVNWHSQHFRA